MYKKFEASIVREIPEKLVRKCEILMEKERFGKRKKTTKGELNGVEN